MRTVLVSLLGVGTLVLVPVSIVILPVRDLRQATITDATNVKNMKKVLPYL